MSPEEFNGLEEADLAHRHDEIDGIVVRSATKTAGKVCPGVRRGVSFATDGAKEAEVSFHLLCLQVEPADHVIDGDVIPERSHFLVREACHRIVVS